MAEEEIICSECGKELVMKFLELKDLTFCSNQCFETYRAKMGRKKFDRRYADVLLPGEGKGWVPKHSNEYIMMCVRCPKKVSDTCQAASELSAVYADALAESEEIRWCCHARFVLSSGLSDGTVPLEAALKVQRHAENKAREQDLKGADTVTLHQSFADLVKNFQYEKLSENPPPAKPMTMSHFGACLLCDEPFGRQCETLCERQFEQLPSVRPLLEKPWCEHMVNVLAAMLIDRQDGEELIKKIIPFADQVAQEKGHPGVITRDLFIALGRML